MCWLSRAWYNGSTKASQALDEGSIPFARTKKKKKKKKKKNKAVPCGRVYFLDCDDKIEPGKVGSDCGATLLRTVKGPAWHAPCLGSNHRPHWLSGHGSNRVKNYIKNIILFFGVRVIIQFLRLNLLTLALYV